MQAWFVSLHYSPTPYYPDSEPWEHPNPVRLLGMAEQEKFDHLRATLGPYHVHNNGVQTGIRYLLTDLPVEYYPPPAGWRYYSHPEQHLITAPATMRTPAGVSTWRNM